MLGEAQWFAQVTPLSGTRKDKELRSSYSGVSALNSLKVLMYNINFPSSNTSYPLYAHLADNCIFVCESVGKCDFRKNQ